jgi:hypothetical protein
MLERPGTCQSTADRRRERTLDRGVRIPVAGESGPSKAVRQLLYRRRDDAARPRLADAQKLAGSPLREPVAVLRDEREPLLAGETLPSFVKRGGEASRGLGAVEDLGGRGGRG